MKLFTKDIDRQLFKQFHLGNDLDNQVVVTKIFNPYQNMRWFIVNSDVDDPDYLWAIVQMGDNVEVGSVSRSELETIRISRFRLPLERDLGFRPVNAGELLRGLREGKFYKKGGWVENENKEMLQNQATEVKHHSDELSNALKNTDHVEAWVVGKMERATTDLSDVTHYLDGESKKMAKGGSVDKYSFEVDSADVVGSDEKFWGGNVFKNGEGVVFIPFGYNSKEEVEKRAKNIIEELKQGTFKGFNLFDNKYFRKYRMADGGYVDFPPISERKNKSFYHLIWDDSGNVKDLVFTDKSEAEEKFEELSRKKGVVLIHLSKETFSEYGHLEKHDTYKMFPKYADGGMMSNGGEVDSLKGKVVRYDLLGGGSGMFVIDDVMVSPSYYSKREVSLYTKEGGVDKFPYERLSDFMSGKSVEVRDSKGEPYTLTLKNVMSDGGEVNKYAEVFDKLKKGDKIKMTFSSGIKRSNERELVVLSKTIVGKGKSYESEKITFKNLENPEGVKYYAYKRKSGYVGFAMGDLAISDVQISFADKMANGGMMADGGEVRRFDRHEQMDSDTRSEILKTIKDFYEVDGFSRLENYLYGLFDGYDYSQTDRFKEEMGKLKNVDQSLYNRINKIYNKIDSYSFTKMSKGGIFEKIKHYGKKGVEKTKQGYGKAKEYTKKQIHDQKKKIALEVIDDTKDSIPNQRDKIHLRASEDFIERLYDKGGMTKKKTTFDDKVKAIQSSLLKRKKVSPKVQKDYGKTYNKKEALASAKRIAGAMRKKGK